MHTDSGMTGISLSGYMPYMTVASLEMSDEPKIFFHVFLFFVVSYSQNYESSCQKRGLLAAALSLTYRLAKKICKTFFFAVPSFPC